MKMIALIMLIFLSGIWYSCGVTEESETNLNPSLSLYYDKPAVQWTQALPLGNGRLGAMVFGDTENETIQFNEETLWSGQPHNYAHKGASAYLEVMRDLLWNNKQGKAQEIGNKHFMSQPFGQLSYLPFGNIYLHFPGHDRAENYIRDLSLESALATVSYDVDDVHFKREVFSSEPAQATVLHVEASKNGQLNFTAGLNCPHQNHKVSVEGNQIILRGKANDYQEKAGRDGSPYPESKLTFEARLKVLTKKGKLVQKANTIEVVGANTATLILVAATSFEAYDDISADPGEKCENDLDQIREKSYEQLKQEHQNDFRSLMNRVSLDLGESDISQRPSDERIRTFALDEDPSLIALLFNYGRYLLISSSRSGTQPANLQGIWNNRLAPPWDSKYTININTEMNYWLAEATNLSECTQPLIDMVKDLSVTGRDVAKEHYNLEGWVTHHNTDLWRGAAPINDANHGIWVTGGAWLCQHLWWHYQYSGDKEYLKNEAYPVLKEASRFFAGYMVPYPDQPEWLVSGPSNSPEYGGLVMGPTMDHQIIRNLFANTIEAAEVLNVDPDFAEALKKVREKIAPNQIGRYGQLQEWLTDIDDPENKHRHVSHLWGLHPGNEIHPSITPELADACKVVLQHRGDGGSGWSRAWKINFWARLLNGDHAYELLKNLIRPSTIYDRYTPDNGGLYENLFDACPPFQIDGNFGASSGVVEMLLQSHLRNERGEYYQDVLPALPLKFRDGSVSGLIGKGGFEISIVWRNGKLSSLNVLSRSGNKLNIRYEGKNIEMETVKGKNYAFYLHDFES